MTNAVLPIMRRQGNGRIINLSSILGLIPAPYSALYAASKHAIEGYSESLDHETRVFGVVSPWSTPATRAPRSSRAAGQARMLRRFVPEAAFSKSLRKQNNLPV
jgi:short-subunit dehydrogenase